MLTTRQLIVLGTALLMITPAVMARRKVEKAGAIKDGLFTDASYAFSFQIHDNWKAKVKKKKSAFRISLTQRNYGVPNEYLNTPDYVKVPSVILFVDTTSLGAPAMIDSLLSDSYKSALKKTALKEFELLAEPELKPRGKRRFAVNGIKGVRWDGQAKYVQEVQISTSGAAGKRVYGTFSGTLVGLKKGKTLILIHVMCEKEFFKDVITEVMEMVNSLNWSDDDDDDFLD